MSNLTFSYLILYVTIKIFGRFGYDYANSPLIVLVIWGVNVPFLTERTSCQIQIPELELGH